MARLTEDRRPIARRDSLEALAWSVETLAHEAFHVRGVLDEALAQCYGVQSTAKTARLLGRSAAEGRRLASVYWDYWYDAFAPRYRFRECRNGGSLDMNPASDVWP